MAKINSNYAKLAAGYLFPEINKRVSAFASANPGVNVYRLGIGNTTEAIPAHILSGLSFGAEKLGKRETYSGYGDEQGDKRLREAIANYYLDVDAKIAPNEVFVSDGAKCDSANIQSIFSRDNVIAVQDPAYPVYIDTNVIAGRTGKFDSKSGQYEGIIYMPCTEEEGFIPNVSSFRIKTGEKFHGLRINLKADLIYLCSPNNPTGAVMNRKSLENFVQYARENKSVIIFDAAYSWYVKDPDLPKSIYQIEGANECAIEIQSFSKLAGFTGVRLGWAVVPMALAVKNSKPGQLNGMWNRRQTTFFNGASNIAQEGGLYVLSPEGRSECGGLVNYYMNNAGIIRKGLESMGIKVYGEDNAPYVWMKNPNGMKSWDFFDKMLKEARVVTTPGAGFGPSGEGYTRLSAFGHTERVQEAVESIKKNLERTW